MTAKSKKVKRKTGRARPKKIDRLRASVEDEPLVRAEDDELSGEARWNRPRKQTISLRVDVEVVDWFKATGPGYQTRINRILRRVMTEGKKRKSER
jgi:uncharacterized protein (DUF4415 family)